MHISKRFFLYCSIAIATSSLCSDDRLQQLCDAIVENNVVLVQEILNSGIDVNKVDKKGMAPLQYAAREGLKEIVKLLIEHDANVNYKNKDNSTPLHYAAFNNHIGVSQILLLLGANVNAKDDCECTPLHAAADSGYADLAQLLILCGARPIVNKYGSTPMVLARKRGFLKCADEIESAFYEVYKMSAEQREKLRDQYLSEIRTFLATRNTPKKP